FKGKTVIPFATHEGSGMGRSERTLKNALPKAKLGASLAVRGATAQNDRDAARKTVNAWLAKQGF
ncbi:MAG: flavodoxin, partial [Pyramidobacter sp.]|nr:flavodoxin [Pyramidobacter sp.]